MSRKLLSAERHCQCRDGFGQRSKNKKNKIHCCCSGGRKWKSCCNDPDEAVWTSSSDSLLFDCFCVFVPPSLSVSLR